MSPVFVLAFRNVTRHRRRSLLAILIIGFGITAMLLSAGFIQFSLHYGQEATIHSQLGHIRVVRAGYLDNGFANPFAYLLPDSASEKNAIQALPHVKTLAPRLAFNGLASFGNSTISFIGDGMDPAREAAFGDSVIITAGRPLSADDKHGIILGQGLATNLGVKIGDTVVLMSTPASGGINAVEGVVRGLFATIAKAYDDAALRVPLPMAQELMRVQGSHSWVLLLDNTDNVDSVLQDLRSRFPTQGLQFVPWTELADFHNKTVALFAKQIGVIKLIIAFIIVLSISNTLVMSVLERTGEIGTSMALGVTRSGTLRQFLAEAALLGVFGSILGLAVGYGLAELISAIGIPMPPGPGMAHGFIAGITVTPAMAIEAFLIGSVTTLLASAYPAWRASRLPIVTALRHNR